MAFLHTGLLEHLTFWFAPCLLLTKRLLQAGARRTDQKVAFTCPALAFHCSGSRAGPPPPASLRPCKCGSPLNFPVHPPSVASGSSQCMGQELRPLPPLPSAEQPLPCRSRAAAPRPRARPWQGSGAGSEALAPGKGAMGTATASGRQEGRHSGWKGPAGSRCSLAKPS